MKYIYPPLILILCGAVVGLMILFKPKPVIKNPEPAIPVVEALIVERKPVQLTIETQGTVTPRRQTTLTAEVSGMIIEVAPQFKEGGFFDKGDVLVTIDSSDYITAEAESEARLAQAQLLLAQEEAQVEQAREDWTKLGKGEPSELVLRKPQLVDARAGVKAAEAALALAQRNLARTQVKAPYAGRVWQKSVDLGQWVSGNSGTPIAVIYGIDAAEIRLPIVNHELGFADLPLGYRGESTEAMVKPKVILRAAFGGQFYDWEGVIDRTEGAIDTRSRVLYAVARVDDPYGRGKNRERPPLKVGLFVQAEIQGKVLENAFEVPRLAIVEDDTVLVIGPDKKLRSRKVEVVKTDKENVVISSGLKAGERICVSPVEFVVEEMPVKLQSEVDSERIKITKVEGDEEE